MLTVIAGSIPPAAVGVHRTFLLALKMKMVVGFIELARTALVLEVVNDVGNGVALQQVSLHAKREGSHTPAIGIAVEVVLAFAGKRIEIQRPEIPVPPLLNWSGRLGGDGESNPVVAILF